MCQFIDWKLGATGSASCKLCKAFDFCCAGKAPGHTQFTLWQTTRTVQLYTFSLVTRHPPMSELKACGVLVTRGDPIREFLLMRHPTRWDLPKGHIDPGETEIECALRELREETGISSDAVVLDPEFRFTHSYQVRSGRTKGELWPKTLVVFLGRLTRDVTLETTEHDGYQWFPWLPPHRIQEQTIDPLLAEVEHSLART